MFKKIRLHHYANYIVIGLLTLIFGIITLAGGRFDNSMLFLLEKVAISIILAVSLSLVVGFLGELSLGHAGFIINVFGNDLSHIILGRQFTAVFADDCLSNQF